MIKSPIGCLEYADFSDADYLSKLDQDTNKTYWNKQQYQASLQNPLHRVYVLKDGSEIFACIVVGIVLDEMEILQFWVANQYHGLGVGEDILTRVLNQVRVDFKVTKIYLEVLEANYKAINLYTKIGFDKVSLRKNYYFIDGKYYDALLMSLICAVV